MESFKDQNKKSQLCRIMSFYKTKRHFYKIF
nr:MAG TPA: hypothetical protein [Caudoviricetes sp.]